MGAFIHLLGWCTPSSSLAVQFVADRSLQYPCGHKSSVLVPSLKLTSLCRKQAASSFREAYYPVLNYLGIVHKRDPGWNNPPPPLSKLWSCLSYSGRRDCITLGPNFIRYQMWCSHIRHGLGDEFASHVESWTHFLSVFAHLNPHSSVFGDIWALYSSLLHLMCVLVVVCGTRKQ